MIKLLIIIILIVTFGACSSDRDFAEEVIGFNLPEHISKLNSNKEFYLNPTGDGEQVAIFSFLSEDSSSLAKKCMSMKYCALPIHKSKLPDAAVFQWMSETDSLGYYKLEIGTDEASYSIAVINMTNKQIIAYRVFF